MFKSFAFTVRPKLGVLEGGELEESFRKLFDKHPGFLVAEKSGFERHLHGQIFFKKAKRKYDFLRDFLVKTCKKNIDDWDPSQERVLKGGAKVAYSDDFYTDYCNKQGGPGVTEAQLNGTMGDYSKEDCSVMIVDNFPKDSAEYYPTEEEQAKVMEKANAKDAKYYALTELYQEMNPEYSVPVMTVDIQRFLYDIMFVSKRWSVIEDSKKRAQLVKCLVEYINADVSRSDEFFLTEGEKKLKKELEKFKLIAEARKTALESLTEE